MEVAQPQLLVLKFLGKEDSDMKLSRRNNKRKLKKPVIVVASFVLVAMGVLLITKVIQSLGSNGPLEVLAYEKHPVESLEKLDLNVMYTNNKSLNKVIDNEIEQFIDLNKDKLTNDVSINVETQLNLKQEFMALNFINGSENIKDIYHTSNIDLKSYDSIDQEQMFHDDLKGLSMVVRKELAKDKDLTYNREMYRNTNPEKSTFKYVNLLEEGVKFIFDKDHFKTDDSKEALVAYEDALPYLNDDLIKRLDQDFVRPDLSNVRYIDPLKPMVSVTYDDGPLSSTSVDVAKFYEENNARISFFWLGSRIDESPEVVKEIANMGHEIANHSYDHSDFNLLNDEELKAQTEGVNDKIKSLTGQDRVLIRPPYGSANEEVQSKVKSPLIMWTVDTMDWQHRDENTTYEEIVSSVYDGAIILMHDLYESSTNSGKKFYENYKNEYQFLTVTELHQYKGVPLVDGQKHFGR